MLHIEYKEMESFYISLQILPTVFHNNNHKFFCLSLTAGKLRYV